MATGYLEFSEIGAVLDSQWGSEAQSMSQGHVGASGLGANLSVRWTFGHSEAEALLT